MPPQVRCAAVFALGTFVGNSAERTDHSTTIDHNVAMMLAQLISDGSPVVRKVRACPSRDPVRSRSSAPRLIPQKALPQTRLYQAGPPRAPEASVPTAGQVQGSVFALFSTATRLQPGSEVAAAHGL